MPDRVKQYAAFSVGHPAAIAAAGFTQKQLTWYMLWFAFAGVAETQMRKMIGSGIAIGPMTELATPTTRNLTSN